MTMVGAMRKSALGAIVVSLAAICVTAAPQAASAATAWWHLQSAARPTYLHPGSAKDEVQEMVVTATGGNVTVIEPVSLEEAEIGTGSLKLAMFAYNAPSSQVQVALEEIYGAGNLQVSGGPGGPYTVTFRGALAGQKLKPVNVEYAPGFGLEGEATVEEVAAGEPDGELVVTAADLGDAPANGQEEVKGEKSPVVVTDRLPAGLKAVSAEAVAGYKGHLPKAECTVRPSEVSCAYSHTLPEYEQIGVVVGVIVESDAKSGELNEVGASGGGSVFSSIERPIRIGQNTPFGIDNYELTNEDEGGSADTQAGSHPFQTTFTIGLNQTAEAEPAALVKDLHFKLPPGMVGNPTPITQCTLAQFASLQCPQQSVVGAVIVTFNEPDLLGISTWTTPLYNLEPAYGEPARFGFAPTRQTPVFIDTAVQTGGDYGIVGNVDNIIQTVGFLDSEVTFWGVPGDSRHDGARGADCQFAESEAAEGLKPSSVCTPLEDHHPAPFMTMPTECTGSLQTSVEGDSWDTPVPEGQEQSVPGQAMPALDGCNRLPFSPSVRVTPDGTAGSTPTGLNVDEHISQETTLVGNGLAESAVKGLTVTLPEGVALNPAAADGLQACSEAQIGLQDAEVPSCPEDSKVATATIRTPVLPDALEGAVYLAEQNQNPFGSLVALYLFAEDPKAGLSVKATGQVVENPVTGQLTTHFERDPLFEGQTITSQYLPPLPAEDIELHFFGGDRAPLTTPALCGAYTTATTFTPWAENGNTESASTFDVTSGPNGAPCHDPSPFAPTLTAGTTSIQAGGFSPFTMTMSREDGQQNLQAVKLKMPPGLLGTLSSVKLCEEPEADAGTCEPESLIGETTVSVGVGGDPFSVTGGKVYITGPYGGAPFGLSIVNPAKAGPFDLGQVVVRGKLEVDPTTSVLTVTTDDTGPYRIPTILDGIPLQIRRVNVTINRPKFTFNPTNCSPLVIAGSLTSTEGSVSSIPVPFQATNCAVLAFKPKLAASTSGKTSRRSGASLTVKLSYPAGPYDANIAKVKVDLPKQLPSRLTTLQKACPAATFEANPARCPVGSIVGRAKASTPVLPVPLSGPAYFVSYGGMKFPELVIVLQGYGVTVHLHGETFIDKAGITSSTFRTIPDVPVGTFELILPQGAGSALAANGSLCASKLTMPTAFVGQNGATIKTSTSITVTGCAKHKPAKKATRHKRETRHKKAGRHEKGK
jgi:hypothetical protein